MSHLSYTNLKDFIVEWHILLVLILGLISFLTLIFLIIWKLKKKKLSYVFIFLFSLITVLILLYWNTEEETRYLWLAYFIYYTWKYLSKICLYSFLMLKCMVLAIPNFLKILATCTPYEKYIFAGEYWIATQLCFFDIINITSHWSFIVFEKLQMWLVEGSTYRLNLIDNNLFHKLFYSDNFLN